MDFAVSGDLSAFTSAEISAAAEWPGDAELFYDALKETGWIDPDGKLHDWDNYAGPCLMSRERQKRYREKKLALRNGNVTETTTIPNLTIPNLTIPKKQKALAQAPALNLPRELEFARVEIQSWLDYKREKGQMYKPKGLDALFKKLMKFPRDTLKRSIENSMASNYAGIFLSDDKGGKNANHGTIYSGQYAGIED